MHCTGILNTTKHNNQKQYNLCKLIVDINSNFVYLIIKNREFLN